MTTYALISNSSSVLRSDGTTIPADTNNADWRDYLDWLVAGNAPTPAAAAAVSIIAAPITTVMVSHLEMDSDGNVTSIDSLAPPRVGVFAAWENDLGVVALYLYPALPSTDYIPEVTAPGFSVAYSAKEVDNFVATFTSLTTGSVARPIGGFTAKVSL